ncbi:Glycolate oxidase 2 [Euphorbia peplus]|nr:Glycolate oxidase 2 [Euphorbia peplus]
MSASCSLEEVASSCNAVRFFQLYVYKRREIAAKLVERAERNDYKAIVLTVDAPRLGRRESDIKHRYDGRRIVPQRKNLEGLFSIDFASENSSKVDAYANAAFDASLIGYSMVKMYNKLANSAEGNTHSDYTPATIFVLEEVVDAVGGNVPVLDDGGVRRGTDVFKVLALGAKAVLVGRPVMYGLAAQGENGVQKVIEMLKDEFELTMALSGCPTLEHITTNHIRTPLDHQASPSYR